MKSEMTTKRTCLVLTTFIMAILFWLSFPGAAKAETFRLTIGACHPNKIVWVDYAEKFFTQEVKKRVKAQTPHKIQWNMAWAGSVAKCGEVLEATQSGLIDVGIPVYPFEPRKLFIHNWCYYVPFHTPDTVALGDVVWEMHQKVPYLTEVFEKKYNQKWLGVGVVNSYNMVTTFPFKKIEDLNKQKIAAAGPNLPWVTGLGAIPVQGTLVEAYTSLQTGVYEGWVMYTEGTVGFKLYEVAPYYTFSGLGGVAANAITVNMDVWKSLPKEIQDIMIQVGKEYSFAEAKGAVELEKKGLAKMKEAGINFYTIPFEERVRWAAKLPDLPSEKAKEADKMGMPGTLVITTFIDELKKANIKLPRDWQVK